jgi:hydroxymethylglutaryl-CoA lyase/(R)-citramalyl-CoA lyase
VRLTLCDVAPGEGLRQADEILEPAMRAELVDRLAAAGLPRIEIASLASDGDGAEAAEAEYVAAAIRPRDGVSYCAVVQDEHGYERLQGAVEELRVQVAASDTLARQLGGRDIAELLVRFEGVSRAVHEDGGRVTAEIVAAFGCPFEGEIDGFRVFDLAVRAVGAGADELVLVDSAGAAVPSRVRSLLTRCQTTRVPVAIRLSDARSTAIACALAAVEVGVRAMDGAVGGMGAAPSAGGLAGTVATEDLVYALEREGVDTGIDLDWLIAVADWLASELGHPLPGRTYRAGRFPPG